MGSKEGVRGEGFVTLVWSSYNIGYIISFQTFSGPLCISIDSRKWAPKKTKNPAIICWVRVA